MDRHEWSGKGWRIAVSDDTVRVDIDAKSVAYDRFENSRLIVRRKWLRYFLFRDDIPIGALSGCKKSDALDMGASKIKSRHNP
ncbi:MAG: hypothetical protein WA860_08755 [Acidimicrobiales bacterium]